MRRIFYFFASLRLTVALLAFSMLLVFLATMEQMQWGVFEVQKKFFESLVAFWHYPPQWPGAASLTGLTLPLPGGFLLGGLLILNLLCAHFRYFRPSWRKTGIVVIHTGIVLLLISGFLTAYLQQEYFMWLKVGQTSDFIESFRDIDLAFIDHTDPKEDVVVSIPSEMIQDALNKGQPIQNPALPFTVRPLAYWPNTTFFVPSQNPEVKGLSGDLKPDKGVGLNPDLGVAEKPFDYAHDTDNFASSVLSIESPEGSKGKWLASTFFAQNADLPFLKGFLPQTFTVAGHTWEIILRARREYLPYSITLDKFYHDKYPGTDVPKRYESDIHLVNSSTGENRPVQIYMNNPLRYAGLTFYQASFSESQSDVASMFQVVRNPGRSLPYIAVALVGIGMCIQFGMSFRSHLKREKARAAQPPPDAAPAPRIPTRSRKSTPPSEAAAATMPQP